MWLGNSASIQYQRLTPGLIFEGKPFTVVCARRCARRYVRSQRLRVNARPHAPLVDNGQEEGQDAARPAGGGCRKAYGRA